MNPNRLKEFSCDSCAGACCRSNTALSLSSSEAGQLALAGTDLRKMSKKELQGNKAGRGRNFYLMLSDCANLDPATGLCTNYENRPNVCREFEMGSYVCEIMRKTRLPVLLGMPGMPQRENPALTEVV